jgi:hypothetical protein
MINASFLLILEIRPAMLLLFHENEKIPDCLGNRNNIIWKDLEKSACDCGSKGELILV